jgi:hypothetical protein
MAHVADLREVGVVIYYVVRQKGEMPPLSKLSTEIGMSAEMVRRTLSGLSMPRKSAFELYQKVYPDLKQYIHYISAARCELTIKGRRLVEGLDKDNQALLYGANRPHAFVPTKKLKVPANKILKPSTSTILEAGVELFRAAHGMPLHELERWVRTLTAASVAGMTLEKVLWSLGVILKDKATQPVA